MSNTMLTTPAGKPVNFIPSTAVALTNASTAVFQEGVLFVGTTGNVKVTPGGLAAGTYITFKNIPSGSFLPIYVKGIHSDTTAQDCLICY
jgi:hypothetical protein